MKEIGLGIMRCRNRESAVKCIRDAYMEGIRYFESATFYHNWECEDILAEGLSVFPREEYQLCAKLDSLEIDEKKFQDQLKKNRVKYFDVYLIQGINRDRMPSCHTIEFLKKKKSQGLIRALGFSFHDTIDAMKTVFELYDGWDIIQLKINYHDWVMDLGIQEVYRYVTNRNIPITVMAPLNGGLIANAGTLEDLREKFIPDWSCAQIALRFFNKLEGVERVLIGATEKSELIEDIHALQSNGFTKPEEQFLDIVLMDYKKKHQIDCTGCKYCETVCPKKIPISKYFEEYNKVIRGENKEMYMQLIHQSRYFDCIGCGNCERKCPQRLSIRFYLHNYMYHTRL